MTIMHACMLARARGLHHPDLHLLAPQLLAARSSLTECEHLNAAAEWTQNAKNGRGLETTRSWEKQVAFVTNEVLETKPQIFWLYFKTNLNYKLTYSSPYKTKINEVRKTERNK